MKKSSEQERLQERRKKKPGVFVELDLEMYEALLALARQAERTPTQEVRLAVRRHLQNQLGSPETAKDD